MLDERNATQPSDGGSCSVASNVTKFTQKSSLWRIKNFTLTAVLKHKCWMNSCVATQPSDGGSCSVASNVAGFTQKSSRRRIKKRNSLLLYPYKVSSVQI